MHDVALARWLFVVALASCGSSDVDFVTKVAKDFRRDGATVSVFGVYKDGRMSADAWKDLAPALSLASNACEPAFGDELVATDRVLADAIDDEARSDGVTEELLDAFATAASGDVILLVTVAGQPPKDTTKHVAAPARPMGGRRRGMGPAPVRIRTTNHDALEMSASLYSIRAKKTVAVVAMTYTGKNADEGLAAFAEKLRAELPALRCAAWKHDVKIDVDRIRAAAQ
jgi:hypothetical protein